MIASVSVLPFIPLRKIIPNDIVRTDMIIHLTLGTKFICHIHLSVRKIKIIASIQ